MKIHLSDKSGKIKIVLFVFNNNNLDYLYSLLFKNDFIHVFQKKRFCKISDGSDNIILLELQERLLCNLLHYNFKNKFIHNCEEDPSFI